MPVCRREVLLRLLRLSLPLSKHKNYQSHNACLMFVRRGLISKHSLHQVFFPGSGRCMAMGSSAVFAKVKGPIQAGHCYAASGRRSNHYYTGTIPERFVFRSVRESPRIRTPSSEGIWRLRTLETGAHYTIRGPQTSPQAYRIERLLLRSSRWLRRGSSQQSDTGRGPCSSNSINNLRVHLRPCCWFVSRHSYYHAGADHKVLADGVQ